MTRCKEGMVVMHGGKIRRVVSADYEEGLVGLENGINTCRECGASTVAARYVRFENVTMVPVTGRTEAESQ